MLRLLGSLLAVVLAAVLAPGVGAVVSSAVAKDCLVRVKVGEKWTYVNKCATGGKEGEHGDGGGASPRPACDLSGRYEFCEGEWACWVNMPSNLPRKDWPKNRPDPKAIYTFKWCDHPDGRHRHGWSWYVPEGPSLSELATRAYGALAPPSYTLEFSPPGRTYVNLSTWFWAEGVGDGAVRGTSAGGVVAIAEPSHIEVDPGDGTGVITCPWAVTESASCSHTYRRASVTATGTDDAGRPAYRARMRLVFDVRFENNGVPLVIPGLPEQWSTGWTTTPINVTEIQTVVTDVG